MRADTLNLRNTHRPRNAKRGRGDGLVERYRPLLGIWAIDVVLTYRAHEKLDADVVTSSGFTQLTGAAIADPDLDDEDYRTERWRRRHIRNRSKTLAAARKRLMSQPVDETLPLVRNVSMLADALGMTPTEQFLLMFAAALAQFPTLQEIVSECNGRESNEGLAALLRHLSGMHSSGFTAAMRDDSILAVCGVLKVVGGYRPIEDKFDLLAELGEILLADHDNTEALISRFVRRANHSELRAEHYPHLSRDLELASAAVTSGFEGRHRGVNILLHGEPGTGKTEFAKVLAEACGAELYEIAFSSADGSPIRGVERLRAYSLSQRILRGTERALLLFDEIEDVFDEPSPSFLLFSDRNEEYASTPGKAWLNRTLECNPVPAIWVTNRVSHIDPAVLRRFDLAIPFPIPPRAVREQIARHHLGHIDQEGAWLAALANESGLTPAQFARAARLAAMVGGSVDRQREAALDSLVRSATVLGQARPSAKPLQVMPYDLGLLNTNVAVEPLLDALLRFRQASLCLYGPPGTGKSELARQLAERTGRPLLVKRASDILSKWVGEAERNIAAMFDEARQDNAVLLLDEADSFLANRAGAHRNWEVTQVNELLTQMERFEGIFVCTTNRIDQMDPASLRRFSHKIRFDPLTPNQAAQLFRITATRLVMDGAEITAHLPEVRSLRGLTPGDFAVVVRQAHLREDPIDPAEMIRILRDELRLRPGAGQQIGFIG